MTIAAKSPEDKIHTLPWDERRGTWGMAMFIATEAALFVMLFFTYFYLGRDAVTWPRDDPPELTLALVMLAVLLTSSGVLFSAERLLARGKQSAARGAVAGTIVLGIAFLVIQSFEYKHHLERLTPSSDAYGSIFYTITSIHGLHVFFGLCMLGYVLLLPKLGPTDRPPYRPLHNAALYWHFVDTVWVFIVGLLYLLPHATRGE